MQRYSNPNTKSQNVHQVANEWNRLQAEAPTLAVFERILDTTLKEQEWKINLKSDCSPTANQSSKSVTQEIMADEYDLDL